jgi:hypothetical protein
VPTAWDVGCDFTTTRLQRSLGNTFSIGWIRHPGIRIGRRGPIEWPPRSPNLTRINFVLWEHLTKHIYVVPPRTVEDLVAESQATVTMVDVNMLRRLRDNAERRSALWWMEASWNIYYNCEGPMDWSFDSLHHLTVTCIFKTESHGLYVIQYFYLSFSNKSHYGELLFEVCVTQYIMVLSDTPSKGK